MTVTVLSLPNASKKFHVSTRTAEGPLGDCAWAALALPVLEERLTSANTADPVRVLLGLISRIFLAVASSCDQSPALGAFTDPDHKQT